MGSKSRHRTLVHFTMRPASLVILSPPECCTLSTWAETEGVSLAVIPAQAGIQFSAPGFRVAACGLARNDGRVVFVIPALRQAQGKLQMESRGYGTGWAFCF